MTSVSISAVLLTAHLAAASCLAESPLNETRSSLEKWVETRQLVSKTRSDWQSDKEMLQQTTDLLERELRALDDQFAKLGTNSTQVDKERLQAETLLQSSSDSLERVTQFAAAFETKLRAEVPRLPAPLQEILKPLLNRMPSDPAATKMLPTDRMQVVVGILNELDKFNNAVSVFSEKNKNEKGEEVAVETLYIGLGAAYFVNDSGNLAGMGTPGPKGWDWTRKPEIASSVREAIRIYRNERPAHFVSLPVAIR